MINDLLNEGYEYLAREEYYTYLFKYNPSNKSIHIKLFDENELPNGQMYLDNKEVEELYNKFK